MTKESESSEHWAMWRKMALEDSRPTQHAYQAACKALWKHRERAASLEEHNTELRKVLREVLDLDPHDPWQMKKAVTDRAEALLSRSEPPWLFCTTHTMPSDLVPAQLVRFSAGDDGVNRADLVNWSPSLPYLPLLDEDGLPCVSSAGLKPKARYVATDRDGRVHQFWTKPWAEERFHMWMCEPGAPLVTCFTMSPYAARHAFRFPGDWRKSLMRAWREGGE